MDKLTKSLPTGEAATLREITDLVAHAYDYDVVHSPSQPALVLLVKRYSNPKDFPQISYEEAERSLHNIILATNSLNPRAPSDSKPGSLFSRLYASLSAEQRSKLKDPIAVSEMRPEQRQLVWQLAHQFYFDSLYSFDTAYARLKGLEDPRTVFCWMDWTQWTRSPLPLFVFGWEGPFGPNHENHKVAISHNLRTGPGGATSLGIPLKAAVASGLIDGKTNRILKQIPDDQTAPAPVNADNAPPDKYAARPDPNALTLREAVQRLNEIGSPAPSQSGSEQFHAIIDDALARKNVTLIGTKMIPPFNLLDAFSRVYGLWIVAQKDKSFFLTLRAPRPCKEAADVPQEVRRMFPEPMWRAMESGSRNFENTDEAQAIKKRRTELDANIPKNLIESHTKSAVLQDAFLAEFAKRQMRVNATEAMNLESIRRIRALVEPLVPKNSGKRLPVVEVSDEAHDALAIFHLTQAVQTLDYFTTQPIPPSLLHFDRAFIQALVGTEGGPDSVAYAIGAFDEKGIPRSERTARFKMQPQ